MNLNGEDVMTVADLIEHLEQLDGSLRVFTHGYEGGYCDARNGQPEDFCLNVNSAWYYGSHEKTEECYPYDEPCDHEKATGIVL